MDKLHDDLIQFAAQHDIPFVLSRRKKITPRTFFESIHQIFISSTIDELGPRFSTHQKLASLILTTNTVRTQGTFMANKVPSSFLGLPVEIVYRILDNLNEFTLVCSVRDVCTRLNMITDTYPRSQ
ncbi:unnamed protein product, partial [Rotaria sp. Silwood1]